MELRGEVNIKGKGLMVTYWLTGKDDSVKASSAVGAVDGDAFTSRRHAPLPSSSTSTSGFINNGYNIFEETKKRLDNLRTSTEVIPATTTATVDDNDDLQLDEEEEEMEAELEAELAESSLATV